MSCAETARESVITKARELLRESQQMGIMRSVDATEASRWLKEVAVAMLDAAGPHENSSPLDPQGGAK